MEVLEATLSQCLELLLLLGRSAQVFEEDWKKVLEKRKKAEAGEGDSKPEGPPILAMSVEPLPEASSSGCLERCQGGEAEREDPRGECSHRERGSTGRGGGPFVVSASAVERPMGSPTDQTSPTTSGGSGVA